MKKTTLILLHFLFSLTIYGQTLAWVNTVGGSSSDYGWTVALDSNKNSYVGIVFYGTADFDPGVGITNLTSLGLNDVAIQKFDSLGNLIWVKQIGGSGFTSLDRIKLDKNGDLLIVGSYDVAVDFDPGPAAVIYTTNGDNNAFIIKLDTAGNYMFGKSLGAGTNAVGSEVVTNSNGELYITGHFDGTGDFDPSAGVSNLLAGASSDIFIVKLDSIGNFIWAKKIGGLYTIQNERIEIDSFDNIYVLGHFGSGVCDFDPGAGVFNLTPINFWDLFVCKLDINGNFIWAKQYNIYGSVYSTTIDLNNNLYITGHFSTGTYDVDPGPAVLNITSTSSFNAFVLKLNSTGSIIWAKALDEPASSSSIGYSISVDSQENVYYSGYFKGTADFDPDLGIYNLNTIGLEDAFVSKLSSNGGFVWVKRMGGPQFDVGESIELDYSGNIYMCGRFKDTVDFDPELTTHFMSSNGVTDAYLLKFNHTICSDMNLLIDSITNINCSTLQGKAYSHASFGATPYNYSWNTSPITVDSTCYFTSEGIYTLTVTDNNNCISERSIVVNGPGSPTGFDMKGNLISSGLRQGFVSHLWVNALNNGCFPVSGKLKLILDTMISFNNSIPTPSAISGDTLIWDLNNFNYDSPNFTPMVNVIPHVNGTPGYIVCNTIMIEPIIGDIDTTNNIRTYCEEATNSYDPNDKKVFPKGDCTEGYIKNNQKLTYTINFQNTGTADAINIFLMDTLNVNMDINSLRVITASHNVISEVLPGNVLKFNFNNIHLPGLSVDEPGSHGFVIYEINILSNLSNETEIKNKAEIYFDFNPAIITNTTLNTITDGIFQVSVSTNGFSLIADPGLLSYQWFNCTTGTIVAGQTNQIFNPTQNGDYSVIASDGCKSDTSVCFPFYSTNIGDIREKENTFSVYPNPANNTITVLCQTSTQIKILSILGEIVLDKKIKNTDTIDISDLNNGIYFIYDSKGNNIKLFKM